MKKKLVRCFRSSAPGFDAVLFTLADFGYDVRLYSCLSCAALFTASGEDEHFSGVRVDALVNDLDCPQCAAPLAAHLRPYPDSFLASDGTIGHFRHDGPPPRDSESTIEELWNLYS